MVFNQPGKHDSVSDTRQAQKRKTGRHREGYGYREHTRHSRHASWLPQVFVFTHEEHLNIKLLQKHVSALSHLSVTLLRLDNSTHPINEKPHRCANLPPISCFEHQAFPSTIFFFSITYEACHFPLPGAASIPRGCPNLPIWKQIPLQCSLNCKIQMHISTLKHIQKQKIWKKKSYLWARKRSFMQSMICMCSFNER